MFDLIFWSTKYFFNAISPLLTTYLIVVLKTAFEGFHRNIECWNINTYPDFHVFRKFGRFFLRLIQHMFSGSKQHWCILYHLLGLYSALPTSPLFISIIITEKTLCPSWNTPFRYLDSLGLINVWKWGHTSVTCIIILCQTINRNHKVQENMQGFQEYNEDQTRFSVVLLRKKWRLICSKIYI